MALSTPQLILEKIRQAPLPQRISFDLTLAHAAAAERVARGDHPEVAIEELCRWLDGAIEAWKPLVIADFGTGASALGGEPVNEQHLGEMLGTLKTDVALEVAQPVSKLPKAGLWSRLCPHRRVNLFTVFRSGPCGFLALTSERAQALGPMDLTLARLVAASISLFADSQTLPPATKAQNATGQTGPSDVPLPDAREGSCLIDPQGKILQNSPVLSRLLGTPPALPLAGENLGRFLYGPESKSALRQVLTSSPAHDSPKPLCLRQPGRGGLVHLETWTLPGDETQPGSLRLCFRDVSEEERLRNLCQSTQAQLHAAVSAPSTLSFEVDRRGVIAAADGGFLLQVGLTPSDLQERRVWSFCEDVALRKRIWKSLRRQGNCQTEITTPHGKANLHLAATKGPNGRPRSVRGLALFTSASQGSPPNSVGEEVPFPDSRSPAPDSHVGPDALPAWLDAFHAAAEAIILVDDHAHIRFLNLAAERLFEARLAEVQGQPLSHIGFAGKHAPPAFLSEPQRPGALHQVTLPRPNGEALALSLACAPLGPLPSQGHVLCCRLENDSRPLSSPATVAAPRDSYAIEQESFKALGTFAGGIAHDLNNILTSLVGNVSLANMLVTEIPEASERLVEAERACFRAKDLSHQLLTFAKGSSPVKKVTRLEDLVQQCAEFYLRGSKAAPRIVNKPGLWSVEVDEGQISQVLENLILNADHSMPHGGVVTIASENYRHVASSGQPHALPLSEGLYVKVTVTDEGPGIPEDQLLHIFKPYHTANESGRGLGLATTFTIVKNHGGHITAKSHLGGGTQFTFYLPATGKTKQATHEPLHFDSEGATRSSQGRILVIDDEKSIRDLATTTLKLMGCDVVACASSSEGVERFIRESHQGSPFDLVIMDLTIPGDMGGNEAMQQILNIAPQARGIASSGYSEGSVMAHYREYGFQAALSKPYNIGDLQRIVSHMLMG